MTTISAKARALAFAFVVAGAGYLVGVWRDWPALRLATKPVPVLCLMLGLLASEAGRYGRLVAAGLAASAAGDVLLEFPSLFVAGLAAFLCAHLCYAAAFVSRARRAALLWTVPVLVWLGPVYATLRPRLGGMAPAVTLYVLAIGVMIWRAAATVGSGAARSAGLAALAGAVLFGLSDTLIGLDRFRAPITGVRYPIILFYWAGQAGIAASARRPSAR